MDTEFLGDGILDEEHQLRPGAGGVDAAAFNLADAVILGNIDEDSSSFETSDSGFHLNQNLSARLYVSGRSQAAMSPDAVPARALATDGLRLTPFERHVLNFIDGKRPVEAIRKAAGLDEAEVKTALATLADKGVIKVVGRALAEIDFEGETVPRSPFRRARVRGSIVGAVALVGDDADRAIEEAFRTQVSLSPLARLRPKEDGANGDKLEIDDADADAFPTGPQAPIEQPPSVPSDADHFVHLKGTDEVERPPPPIRHGAAKDAAAKDAAAKDAVSPRRPPSSLESADASLLEQSDGFDEFSSPSEISAAMLAKGARKELSDSAPPIPRAKANAFADLSGSGAPLAGLDELADSRVQARPDFAAARDRKPAAKPPMRPALADPPRSGRPDSPSQERERDAASGEVWDDNPGKRESPPAPPKPRTHDSSLSDLLSDAEAEEPTANVAPEIARELMRRSRLDGSFEEATAAGQPMPPQVLPRVGRARGVGEATGRVPVPKSRSAMASMPDEHIVDDDVDEHSGLHALKGNHGAADDIFEDDPSEVPAEPPEDTAHRPGGAGSVQDSIDASEELDPLPVPARPPRAAQERAQFADADSEPSASGAGARADDSRPDTGNLDDVFRRPGAAPSVVDDDDDDLFMLRSSQDASAPGSSLASASASVSPSDSDAEIEDEASAFSSSAQPTHMLDRGSDASTNDIPARVVRPVAGTPGLLSTHAHSMPSEETLAPSQAGDSSEAPPPRARAPVPARPSAKAPPPAVITEEPPHAARARQPAPATNRRAAPPPEPDSSSEMVDSALLIRPAAKVVPLVAAVAAVKGGSRPRGKPPLADPLSRPLRAAPPQPASSEELGSSERDASAEQSVSERSAGSSEAELSSELSGQDADSVEATQNLDRDGVEQLRDGANRGRGVGVGRGAGNAAAIPSDFSEVAGKPQRAGAPRPKPTDEMRRKGRQLFDEAKKEFAAGRVGAARMNAKLASIYDPENDDYQRALEDWDENGNGGGAKKKGPAAPPTVPKAPEMSSDALHSDERQRDMRALYDEAQDFENQGDFDEAIEVLYRGIDRFPNAAAFHNRIGVLLAMKKRDFDGAISSIQRAIELDPDNLHYKNNLGKVMQRVRPRA
jgi:Tetratricopeptide repeat